VRPFTPATIFWRLPWRAPGCADELVFASPHEMARFCHFCKRDLNREERSPAPAVQPSDAHFAELSANVPEEARDGAIVDRLDLEVELPPGEPEMVPCPFAKKHLRIS